MKIKILCIVLVMVILSIGIYCAYADTQSINSLLENIVITEALISEQDSRIESLINNTNEFENIADYVSMLSIMSVDKLTTEYLDSLITDGYIVHEVMAVYKFCRGTDCDVSTVKQVLDLKDSFTGPHWIENAYNYITGNKYGVLDYEQVCEYLNNGYTTEDIIAANMLCRKGKYTINDILSKFGDGETWTSLYNDIENISTSFFSNTPERSAADIIEMLELKNNYGVTDETLSSLNSSTKIAEFKQAIEEKHIEVTQALLSTINVENEVTE